MWQIIFIATFPYIFGVATRSVGPLEVGPLWSENIDEALSSAEDYPSVQSNIFKQRYEELDNVPNSDPADDPDILRTPSNKRALAMFARWGAVNGIGKNRTPIRSKIIFDPDESISAQTRSRMLGQPLRWG